MATQRPSEREHTTTHNGIDRETTMTASAQRVLSGRPEMQGYVLMLAGLALLLFGLGIFPLLKWAIVGVAAVMFLVGLVQSNVIMKLVDFVHNVRKRI